MSKWLEAKQIKGKFYIDSSDFYNIVKEYSDKIKELEEENKTLKDNVEFLHSCLDDRDNSIELLKNELMEDMKTETKLNEEIKKLKSREEKLIAYYKWYVDKEHDLTEVEDIITENIKLKEERDFFKEQAMLWRKDYTNEYEKNRNLIGKLESLEK